MRFVVIAVFFSWIQSVVGLGANQNIPLYGLFETSLINTTSFGNPFADVWFSRCEWFISVRKCWLQTRTAYPGSSKSPLV